MHPQLKILSLSEFEHSFNQIASLRFDYFGEFPYLYAGCNLNDEHQYLSGYFQHPDGRLIVFNDEKNILGMCTGYPLAYDMGEPFNITGWARSSLDWNATMIQESYYLGEIITQRDFRDTSILKQVLKYGYTALRQHGYRYLTFITVERPKHHPMRPEGYRDFGDRLERFKFQKLDLTLNAPYNTSQPDGSYKMEVNPMAFWVKDMHTTHSILN